MQHRSIIGARSR